MAAIESLRQSLRPGTDQKGDVRFQFGTEYSSNFMPPPAEEYNYGPLPAVYQPEQTKGVGRHLAAKTGIFPRLHSSIEEVKGKLAPVHTQLTTSLKRLDITGSGYVNMEALEQGLKETGVFLSKADVNELAGSAPRSVTGHLDYVTLLDSIVRKGGHAGGTTSSLPTEYQWAEDAPLAVSLRLHNTTQPYEVSAENMQRFARKLTDVRRTEADPEKVFNLMRHHLLQELLIAPGPPSNPDLSFRQWLMFNGVLARTQTRGPGVIPPEVYEVLNQIIGALGLPPATSALMTPTELGASLRHTTQRF